MLYMGMMGLLFGTVVAGVGTMLILSLLVLVFRIWMIVDCFKRNFKNNSEKIIWVVVLFLFGLVSALVYFIVIKSSNPQGLMTKR